MNTLNSKRFQQQSLVVVATVGLTAAIALAAFGPDAMRAQSSSTPVTRDFEGGGIVKVPARDVMTPRFERSDEPAIEGDLMNAHGG